MFPETTQTNLEITTDKIKEQLPQIRKDLKRLFEIYDRLKEVYPQVIFVEERHPKLAEQISQLKTIVTIFDQANVSDKDLLSMVDEYNRIAKETNRLLHEIQRESTQEDINADLQNPQINDTAKSLETDIKNLSEEEKVELRQFVKELWEELFPETYTQHTVKRWLFRLYGDDKLETWQKYLMAPANGLEDIVVGFIDLADPETQEELIKTAKSVDAESIKTFLKTLYQDFQNFHRSTKLVSTDKMLCVGREESCRMHQMINILIENTDWAEMGPKALSLVYSLLFTVGTISKISKILKLPRFAKFSPRVVGIIKGLTLTKTGLRYAKVAGRALPFMLMAELVAPYIYKENLCEP